MTTERNKMKVYAVIAGVDCEGEVFDTLRLFDCKSTAEAYYKELDEEYDYALMEVREVCMNSLIIS